jgi:hypothetical protein
MFKFLKKDSMWLGIILGIVMPGAVFLILYFINQSIRTPLNSVKDHYLTNFMVQILSLVINLLVMRYYLINLKADKTGRGILLVTFIIGVTCFILNWN